ncbi:uncharacterized protein DUF559 [Melghirimyces profundicolus]|uniref:Uncharacterized protein DUF559 n=1 Tax=Melghirimyces profundicolus TaxID=1242148 RepID=A0A2T6B9F7_9BACL|nr:tellurite resistance TerB C-terminal domain-containing protein [Melghirimyces profundicolus]PTX52694.1 uncharacterized protein DUF559 [Melghirimyces profundicolus]
MADIQAMVKEPALANRTFGVISLLGNDQAQFIENRLREAIGEEEMLKRKIICGDAYAFQGDERDIIFLSMVVADNVRFQAQVRKDAKQRFNVAASRAKNQLRLYHSVDLKDLNPDDLRYRLLNYCLNPHRVMEQVENAEALCESRFEKEVLRMILAQGYRVRPQVQVGRYRIDLVVEGLKNRLAVECDGDRWHGPDRWEEDMLRQQTLERAGWTFWRIRGSTFYRDRKKAMESLWRKLEEMGIEKEAQLNEAETPGKTEELQVSLHPPEKNTSGPETTDNQTKAPSSEEQAFLFDLTATETEFLTLFANRKEVPTHQVMDFARSQGLMLRKLIDDINEKAVDHLGDLLLHEQGRNYVISEEWVDVVLV